MRTWFARRFPDGPTQPQLRGWAEIAAGQHTLIAAPTGSGKTLAAFLVCIDRMYRAQEARADQDARTDEGPAAEAAPPRRPGLPPRLIR